MYYFATVAPWGIVLLLLALLLTVPRAIERRRAKAQPVAVEGEQAARAGHHGRMSELVPISGEVVKAPPAAEVRYGPDDPDAVTRVFVRVEYADGRIREYQAVEPQDFTMADGMAMRQSRAKVSAGGLFVPLTNAVATLRLSFTAHPRHNIHIRTEATAPAEFEGIVYK